MTQENDKFVEEMLKKVKENKETKPQSRTEGVNKDEVEDLAKNVWKIRDKDSSD